MLFRGFNPDNGILVAEFDGIVEKVVQYLLDLPDISFDIKLVTGEDEFNGNHLLPAGAFKGGSRVTDDGVDVKAADIQEHSLRIQVI